MEDQISILGKLLEKLRNKNERLYDQYIRSKTIGLIDIQNLEDLFWEDVEGSSNWDIKEYIDEVRQLLKK